VLVFPAPVTVELDAKEGLVFPAPVRVELEQEILTLP
jgi:DNA-binding transcriptional regulator/RsmH inhibitor MraZ